ncbi:MULTISPECIES: RluA family pseudouridine synthase [unclassified Paenibacillus]|uniref:RluA family pseudouridine synthase n=1 Tax=unclassified Paenibacillus TaxID=185978 RepID=UPI00020D6725|nr:MULTISPECIES: RluA family pseudouridine synthase [unclassified Paenibacillus]EGL15482.1 pseudouridine synthase, RluA family [Paenibacillus sp. HGF7]EPD82842.1 RluA family pseudouridine synthase [Paenibacillus sp. HGH0039]
MINYYSPLTYVVPPDEEGFYLKTILQNRMGLSRKLLSRLKLTEQGITVNGKREYINIKVNSGDVIEIRMQEEESEDILPQDLPLEILYEDEHLLIVNKESGMIVHPTHGHYLNTVANAAVHHWKERGENVRFRPVHRLDQETSGVLAIAKNPYVHQQISEQMIAHSITKEYLAIVHGTVVEDRGTIDAPIDRDPEQPHVRIVTPSGYRAVTHYETVRRYDGITLVRLMLETGRTHQIRVHMKHLGHPLLGDKMYGPDFAAGADCADGVPGAPSAVPSPAVDGEAVPALARQALHAYRLGFVHPGTRERVEFTAPLPADMQAVLDACR